MITKCLVRCLQTVFWGKLLSHQVALQACIHIVWHCGCCGISDECSALGIDFGMNNKCSRVYYKNSYLLSLFILGLGVHGRTASRLTAAFDSA